MKYDVFLSHASEDTEEVARPLADELKKLSIKVWFDRDQLTIGDSLRESIDRGLSDSRFGIIVVSPNFFRKNWTQQELNALFIKGTQENKTILPIWHKVTAEQVQGFSPLLADIYAASTASGIENVAREVARSIGLDRTIQKEYGYILSIGASNGEYVLKLSSELKLDQKHIVESHSLFGGSGVNYALRLINVDVPVIPILSIGADDLGRDIRRELYEAAVSTTHTSNVVLDFIRSERFFVPEARTQRSTIIVSGLMRTIFTEKAERTGDFLTHLKSRVNDLGMEFLDTIKVVLIGHIHADRKNADRSQPGECTKYIIQKFVGKSFIYANFGNSQIELGYKFWEEYLSSLTVLQLNLNEMRALFRKDGQDKSLIDIVDWLNNKKITTVITLDKLGAVCTYGDGREGLILALPFKLRKVVDTTGAGDAFGAAIMAHLYRKAIGRNGKGSGFSFGELLEAVKEARFWAAYACGYFGGSANCPTKTQLTKFMKNMEGEVPLVEVTDKHGARTVLYLLDRAYSHHISAGDKDGIL
ncbi:MAG: TIR domain-containing protein [Deltaproteobacteria bacterium]|nr:TIR domain-containing protein [Deltaproteobacteria bacterium]